MGTLRPVVRSLLCLNYDKQGGPLRDDTSTRVVIAEAVCGTANSHNKVVTDGL